MLSLARGLNLTWKRGKRGQLTAYLGTHHIATVTPTQGTVEVGTYLGSTAEITRFRGSAHEGQMVVEEKLKGFLLLAMTI